MVPLGRIASGVTFAVFHVKRTCFSDKKGTPDIRVFAIDRNSFRGADRLGRQHLSGHVQGRFLFFGNVTETCPRTFLLVVGVYCVL